jgi:hypothetical protein
MAPSAVARNLSVLLVSFALVACSSESGAPAAASAAGTGPKGDACSMLTADAISAAIGKTVGEGRKTNESGTRDSHMVTCTWETTPRAEGVSAAEMMRDTVSVQLILWSWPSEKSSTHYIESFRKVAQETNEPEPTPLSLGDEAILDGTSVHVRRGTSSFTVNVQVFGDADQKAAGQAAETLAKQVIGKL